MRFLNGLCAALCLLAGTPVKADLQDRARIAGIIGSDRLRMFTYGKLLETGGAPRAIVTRMKQTMVRQGFYHEAGQNPVIARQAWAAPILGYDGNINGGTLQNSFRFNGFVFDADPAFRAKAGLVMGLSAGGMMRLAWANGRYVEGQLHGEAVWSPEHSIGRTNAELGLCSRNHVKDWTFIDMCYSASKLHRELGTSQSQKTSLSLSQLFQAGAGFHEMTVQLARAQDDNGVQPSITLSWGAVWDHAATNLSLTKAAPKAGETALNTRIAADVQWLLGGRAVGVGVWHQSADGGTFLGTPRKDATTGMSLSYELRPGLTAQIGFTNNQSNIDFFDAAQTSIGMRFNGLRW